MRYEQLSGKKSKDALLNTTAQDIVSAAKELFLQKGYKSVSVREIAEAANVNLGLIPYYFSTKDNLANKVYTELTNEMYTRLSQKYRLDELETVVQMYVYTVLTLEKADPDFYRFFCEYLEAGHGNEEASEEFIRITERIIAEYGVKVTPAENEAYLLAMKGAERLLHIKRQQHRINLSVRQIFNIILSDYMYNIGLSDKEIAKVIEKGNEVLDAIG